MDYSFMHSIAEDYWNGDICDISQNTREEQDFCNKYINPVLQNNREYGLEMEDMFAGAIASEKDVSFKDGFRAGVKMMMECCGARAGATI